MNIPQRLQHIINTLEGKYQTRKFHAYVHVSEEGIHWFTCSFTAVSTQDADEFREIMRLSHPVDNGSKDLHFYKKAEEGDEDFLRRITKEISGFFDEDTAQKILDKQKVAKAVEDLKPYMADPIMAQLTDALTEAGMLALPSPKAEEEGLPF
jgi:hypothetical protein